MKRILLLTSFFTAFVFSHGAELYAGFSFESIGKSFQSGIKSVEKGIESGLESVEQIFSDEEDHEDLSSNIMRRVNAANLDLDKAEEQIRTGRSEHAPKKLKSARKEYNIIFEYYGGSFDPDHPTLTELKARIDRVEGILSAPRSVAATPFAEDKSTRQPVRISSAIPSASPARVESQTTQISAKTQTGAKSELSANIRRRIDDADSKLDMVHELASRGEDDPGSLGYARGQYNKIFEYYGGSFDPDHPDIVGLKSRIDAAEIAMNKAVAKKNAITPIESNSRVVADLPRDIGADLISIAGSLRTLELRLETAAKSNNPGSYVAGVKSDLEISLDKLTNFNQAYAGRFDTNHVAYVQVKTRLQEDKLAVSRLENEAKSIAAASNASRVSAYSAEAQKIMQKYNNQQPTSNLHRNNPGRMVWSTSQITFDDQDKITTQTSFKLSEPIFGRLYMLQSLGNTPVYGKGEGARPSENYEFRYIFRLFIDGEEKIDKFGVFVESKLKGKGGESWTTFQLAPNPVPFDHDFRDEAEAWRRVTKNLGPGTHGVRFEFWGEQGQYRSREPISVGEFSLVVGQGERLAAGMKFPDDSYTGSDVNKVRADILNAIVGPVARNRNEILKVSVTSNWRPGVYTDSKKPYRKISGTVLWHDKDNDSVCRFNTYNFISDSLGGNNWTALRYKSFTTGSMEGDAECP